MTTPLPQSFGYRVIRDLMKTDAGFYFGWTMDITAANRAVVSIPFEGRRDPSLTWSSIWAGGASAQFLQ